MPPARSPLSLMGQLLAAAQCMLNTPAQPHKRPKRKCKTHHAHITRQAVILRVFEATPTYRFQTREVSEALAAAGYNVEHRKTLKLLEHMAGDLKIEKIPGTNGKNPPVWFHRQVRVSNARISDSQEMFAGTVRRRSACAA